MIHEALEECDSGVGTALPQSVFFTARGIKALLNRIEAKLDPDNATDRSE